jgi:hypothetical protein
MELALLAPSPAHESEGRHAQKGCGRGFRDKGRLDLSTDLTAPESGAVDVHIPEVAEQTRSLSGSDRGRSSRRAGGSADRSDIDLNSCIGSGCGGAVKVHHGHGTGQIREGNIPGEQIGGIIKCS